MGRAEKRKCERKLWLIVSGFCFSDFSLESEFAQFYPTLCDPVDCSPPGSSIHRILQARVLEWVASSFSRGSSQPRDQTQVSRIAGRHFKLWATRGARFLIRTSWKHRDLVSLSQHLALRPVIIPNWTSIQSKGKAGMEMKGWDGTLLHDKHQLLWEQESQSCAVHIDITRGVSFGGSVTIMPPALKQHPNFPLDNLWFPPHSYKLPNNSVHFFIFWLSHVACRILVLHPGIEPRPLQ